MPAITGSLPGHMLDAGLDELAVLLEVDGGRLAGSADHHDPVGAFRDMPVDQATQRVEVETAVLEHRRDNGYQAAL